MKKISVFLICAVLFSSCSLTLEKIFLLPVPTPTSIPTLTNSPTDVPTFTPITPSLTFTLTPTLVGKKTETPTPEFTATRLFETPLLLITPNTPTPGIEMKGFLTVNISDKEFYKEKECQPASVKITAQVMNPADASFVALFVRFKTKLSGVSSEWTKILIQTNGSGTFTHDLVPDEMKSVAFYQNAWVQYQFVAYNSKNKEIGRTGIFSESLTLLDCKPTPIPTLSPTPTVLIP